MQHLAGEFKDAGLRSEVDPHEFVKRDEKIEERSLKVQLLAKDSEKVAHVQAQVTAEEVQLTATRLSASLLTKAFGAITRAHPSLPLKLYALHVAEIFERCTA